MLAKKSDSEFANRRATQRFDYDAPCTLSLSNRKVNAVSLNISAGGMAVQLQGLGRIDMGDVLRLRIGDFPAVEACVCWMSGRKIGLQFVNSIEGRTDIRALLHRLEHGEPAALPMTPTDVGDAPVEQAVQKEQTLDEAVAAVKESVARTIDRP